MEGKASDRASVSAAVGGFIGAFALPIAAVALSN